MKNTILTTLCLFATSCFAQVTVSVSAPTAYATVTAPFHIQATGKSSHPITGWQVYLDNNSVAAAGATGTLSTDISTGQGTHQIVVRAWDSTGAFGSQAFQATVSGADIKTPVTAPSGALPAVPSNAKVFSAIDEMTSGWASCNSAACAGGAGGGALWQAFNQGSPSMDGRSMQIYHDGKWSNALWYRKMGAVNSATNFLWDFYVQLDNASLTNAQTLEYDAFQFVGGYNYMIGTQCNYAAAVWDTWNEVTQQWLHTKVPCKKFAPGSWHHIQWYMTTNHSNHTYTYKTLVVDGVAYTLNQTQPAKYLGWGDNLGAQWQLDVNATGGGYHEWIDKAVLSVW